MNAEIANIQEHSLAWLSEKDFDPVRVFEMLDFCQRALSELGLYDSSWRVFQAKSLIFLEAFTEENASEFKNLLLSSSDLENDDQNAAVSEYKDKGTIVLILHIISAIAPFLHNKGLNQLSKSILFTEEECLRQRFSCANSSNKTKSVFNNHS